MRKQKNIRETLEILHKGYYIIDQLKVDISLSTGIYDYTIADIYTKKRQKEIQEDSDGFMEKQFYPPWQHKVVICQGASYELAKQYYRPLIMNSADAFIPGGGWKEEKENTENQLCRATSLYCSLSSEAASQVYSFHENHTSDFLSDSMILSPMVAVIFNQQMELIPDPYPIAVLSMMPLSLQNHIKITNPVAVDAIMKARIRNFFLIAARNMYRNLILTPYGCEEYGHKPENIARYIKEILLDEEYQEYFEHIVIAIDPRSSTDSAELYERYFHTSHQLTKQENCATLQFEYRIGEKEYARLPENSTVCAYEVKADQRAGYLKCHYPFPCCSYQKRIRLTEQYLGYAQVVLNDGLPVVAELFRIGEQNKLDVVFVFPKLESVYQIVETTNNSIEQQSSSEVNVRLKEQDRINGILCSDMEKCSEKLEQYVINQYLSYLIHADLLQIRKSDIEGFAHVLYDRAGHKVIALELTLVSYHQVNAVVTLKFDPF